MSEITRLLSAAEEGDPRAAERLLPLVYHELRELAAQRLAREKPGQTIAATSLVHEAYARLVDGNQAQHWNRPGPFLRGRRRGDAPHPGRSGPPSKGDQTRGRDSPRRALLLRWLSSLIAKNPLRHAATGFFTFAARGWKDADRVRRCPATRPILAVGQT
jgi:hypothetical protein